MPLTEKQQQLVRTLEVIRIEEMIPRRFPVAGRPRMDRTTMARAFVAKAVYDIPTTRVLLDRLSTDAATRRICGWERKPLGAGHEVPGLDDHCLRARLGALGLPVRGFVHLGLGRRPRGVGSGEDAASGAHPLCALPVPAVGACRRGRRSRRLADGATRPQPPGGLPVRNCNQLMQFPQAVAAAPHPRRSTRRCSCPTHEPVPWRVESCAL